jgi:uncharacterized protein
MKTILAVTVAAAALLAGLPAPGAIDCSRARSGVDRLLCSSDRVARADQIMALAFREAFHRTDRREALLAEQERWRKQVRDACNDVPCLMRAYEDRTSELETW